jgi:HD-GYP domain-containing protein (c-di-GMP phosphodiesterase class II)
MMGVSLVPGGKGCVADADAERRQADEIAFIAVRLASLRVDTYTPFDLYISQPAGRPYVLYREKNLQFTEASRLRLEQHNMSFLYVPASQVASYRAYVEQELGHILDDLAVPIEEKSHILYDSAMGLSKDVIDNPRSGDLFSRCDTMVRHEVAFVMEQEGAFKNLLNVTSYDYYTYTHSVNVSLFCIAISHAMDMEEYEILQLGNGALLHDIGKTMISPQILNCTGKLSEEEWRIMRLHPIYGYNMLKRQGCTDGVVLDMVRHHHEKLSGKGYPDNLRSREVSEPARISAIADIFDALTTRRPYKAAMPTFAAFRLMQSEMGTDLDAYILNRFVGLVGKSGSQPGGSTSKNEHTPRVTVP